MLPGLAMCCVLHPVLPRLHMHSFRKLIIKIFREESDNTTNKIIEYTYSMRKALLFQKAMVLRPEHEMKAPERGGNQGDKD